MKTLSFAPLLLSLYNQVSTTSISREPCPVLPPFYAIEHEYVSLPVDVFPYAPSWGPDGSSIAFNDYNGGQAWILDVATRKAKCVTCGIAGATPFYTGFTYIFPGNKKLFVANQLGSDVYILECEGSVLECSKPQLLNLTLTGDTATGQPSLGRRTYHLAPDGEHVAYTNTRPDGLAMLVAKLNRTSTGYNAINYRVINPEPPLGAYDTSFQRWSNAADLTGFKAFVDGGASAIFVGQSAAQNPDQFKIDLATGNVTRLSTNPDWDEDGALSPDGSALVTHSWRTMNRIAPFGLFEPALPLTALMNAAAAAGYYVSSKPGYACDLVPWLLPADGDAAGPRVIGQPLAPYSGGSNFAACNTAGQPLWSPDSTRVLLQQRSFNAPAAGSNVGVLEFGPAPASILIARLVGKAPTKGMPVVQTNVGSWAPSPQAYKGNTQYPGSHILNGVHGFVNFTIEGNLAEGSFSAVYSNFSADGTAFVHGLNSVSGSPLSAVTWSSELDSVDGNGKLTGYQWGNVTYAMKTPTPPTGQQAWTIAGPLRSSWNGVNLTGYGTVGACPGDMPKPQQLILELSKKGTGVEAVVSANIFGDVRPVLGATVSSDSATAVTDAKGMTTFEGLKMGNVTATAGTFLAATKVLPLQNGGNKK